MGDLESDLRPGINTTRGPLIKRKAVANSDRYAIIKARGKRSWEWEEISAKLAKKENYLRQVKR